MAKNFQCTEIQLTLHTIILVIIGVLIGSSLVGSADEIESELSDKIYSVKSDYDKIMKNHSYLVKKFKNSYDFYKGLVYNGSEVSCKKIGNYAIDTSSTNEITIYFSETFSEPPLVFLSVNGFDFQPKLVKEDKENENIDFILMEVNEKYFKLSIESTDPEFSFENFDRLDLCYLAFTDISKDYDPLGQAN